MIQQLQARKAPAHKSLSANWRNSSRDGPRYTPRGRPVANGLPPEAIANRIDATVGDPSRHTLLRTGTALIVHWSYRQLELQERVLL